MEEWTGKKKAKPVEVTEGKPGNVWRAMGALRPWGALWVIN